MRVMNPKLESGGMTLVELMVALAITALVMTLSVSIFSGQIRSYNRGQETKEIQETNQESIEILRRDLAQAGWSVRPSMGFFVEDGGPNASDRIYVNDTGVLSYAVDPKYPNMDGKPDLNPCEMVLLTGVRNSDPTYGCPGVEGMPECPGCAAIEVPGSSVKLSKLDIKNDPTRTPYPYLDFKSPNQYVITDSGSNKVAKIESIDTGTSTLTLDKSITGIYLAPAVYYCVDDGTSASNCHTTGSQWVLRRSDRTTGGDREPLASNVVDLQVAYQDTDGDWYGAAGCSGTGKGAGFCARSPFDSSEIALIRLTLVTRTEDRVGGSASDPKSCRPAAENHTAGTGVSECGYVYRVHTTTVHPRYLEER